MSSYRIYLKQPPANIPSHYYDNGRVYLDLPTDFDLSLWNAPTRTKLDGFTELAVMQGDLPSTPKNDYILALYNDVNFLNPDYTKGIDVLVENGGITLPQQSLQIESYSKANKKYSFSLAYTNDDIVNSLKSIKLCDLMGDVQVILDRDDIVNVYRFMSTYDGSSAFCLPPQNYGHFYYLNIDSTTLPIHAVEFRPNLFAKAVFERAFCGFRLEGSFLDTDFFKKFITYDIRPDYDQFLAYKRGFKRESDLIDLDGSSAFTIKMYHPDIIADPDNNYQVIPSADAGTSSYNRHGVYNVRATVNITTLYFGGGTYASIDVTFNVKKNTGEVVHTETKNFFTPPNNIYQFVFEGLVDMKPDEGLYIECVGIGTIGAVGYDVATYSTTFTMTPVRDTTPYEGEIFTLREALDQDATVYDYIKGISDMCQLNYTINRATGVIGIYPKVNTSVFGESYNPLINPNLPPLDWSDKCDPNELDIRFPKEQRAVKDITAGWKSATDRYVTEVINPDPELYSYYRLVNGTGSESLTFENKLFQPSATDQYYFDADLKWMPDLPILLDNQDNKKSYNLGHRIFLLVGLSSQAKLIRYLSEINSPTAEDNQFFCFCTMYYPKLLLNDSFDSFTFDKNLTFDKLPTNLFTTFIEKITQETIESAEFDKPILLSREDFLNYDFTRLVVVKSNLNQTLCKVIMIKDFSLSKVKYTPVTLRPYIPRC